MKNIFKNWKTTSAGILAIIGGVVMYMHDKTKIVEASAAILGGIGLIFAADGSNVNPSA